MEIKEQKETGFVGRIMAKVVGQELSEKEMETVSGGTKAICHELGLYDSVFGCDDTPQW